MVALWSGVATAAIAAAVALLLLFKGGGDVPGLLPADQLAYSEVALINELHDYEIIDLISEENEEIDTETIEGVLLEDNDLMNLIN